MGIKLALCYHFAQQRRFRIGLARFPTRVAQGGLSVQLSCSSTDTRTRRVVCMRADIEPRMLYRVPGNMLLPSLDDMRHLQLRVQGEAVT